MGKEILMFKDIEKIKKINLHQKKKDVDIKKVLVSNKISFGEKSIKNYFKKVLYWLLA